MEKSIVINSFQWGLSNTKTVGQTGSFYDSKSIDYRKNPEYVTLNRLVSEQSTFYTGASAKPNVIALTNYSWWWTVATETNLFCQDWRVYEQSTGEIYYWDGWAILNVANLNGYNYMLCATKIERFVNAVRSNVLATNTFASGWTGANWTTGTHTAWATTAYTQSSPIVTVTGERYHIIVDVTSQSAWTCTVTIWGTTSSNLAVWRNDIYLVTANTNGISFTPSSDSTIVLSYVRVDRVSTLASPDGLWVDNSYKSLTTTGVTKRPYINFFWDLIFGNGSSVARLNKDETLIEYSASVENPVIGWLDGTVYAITQIATNIYVWCNNWGTTNIYLWDGVSTRPSQKLTIADRPIINVALLSNQHYWWSQKWVKSQKFVHIGENISNQVVVKSDIPHDPTSSNNYEQDRLALYGEQTNAIETFGDYIFLPWYGKIYSFGSYYPWISKSLNKEFTYDGGECTAMLTPTNYASNWTPTVADYYMLVTYENNNVTLARPGSYYLGIIDFREWNGSYASTGYIDTMEYSEGNIWVPKNLKKLLVPIELINANCSIKVYTNVDQAWFTLQKMLTTSDYWTGFTVAEIPVSIKWHTLQVRYELITTSSTYSPRLYVWQNIVSDITELNKSSTYGR